jgi:hypothetical protein
MKSSILKYRVIRGRGRGREEEEKARMRKEEVRKEIPYYYLTSLLEVEGGNLTFLGIVLSSKE